MQLVPLIEIHQRLQVRVRNSRQATLRGIVSRACEECGKRPLSSAWRGSHTRELDEVLVEPGTIPWEGTPLCPQQKCASDLYKGWLEQTKRCSWAGMPEPQQLGVDVTGSLTTD